MPEPAPAPTPAEEEITASEPAPQSDIETSASVAEAEPETLTVDLAASAPTPEAEPASDMSAPVEAAMVKAAVANEGAVTAEVEVSLLQPTEATGRHGSRRAKSL